MIFTNESSTIEKCIHSVKAPSWSRQISAKSWCVNQTSIGYFCISRSIPTFWLFELEQDALIFALKWSSPTGVDISIEKTVVTAKMRTLSAKWTAEIQNTIKI